MRSPDFTFLFAFSQVDTRCSSGQIRLASSRVCVNPTTYSQQYCKEQCGVDGGNLDAVTGHCKCNKYVTLNEVCNKTCQANSPTTQCTRNAEGTLVMLIKDALTSVITEEKIYNELGFPDYDRDKRNARFIEMKVTGMFGIHFRDSSQALAFNRPSSARKRRAVTTDPAEIRSPLICSKIGETIVFKVNINPVNRSLSNYPQYRKNHLFNTNPNFDYGYFRLLHTYIQNTNQTISTFVQVFHEAGVYVFYDNAQPARETIVMVPKLGASCPNNIGMEAATSEIMTIATVKKQAVSLVLFFHFFFYLKILNRFSNPPAKRSQHFSNTSCCNKCLQRLTTLLDEPQGGGHTSISLTGMFVCEHFSSTQKME